MATRTEIAVMVANRRGPFRLAGAPGRARAPSPSLSRRAATRAGSRPAWALTGRRAEAYCPACQAAERHRLQALVVDAARVEVTTFAAMSMLHIAPEPILAGPLPRRVRARTPRRISSARTST